MYLTTTVQHVKQKQSVASRTQHTWKGLPHLALERHCSILFYPTCQEQSPRTHQNQQPRPAILQTGETGPLSVKELSVFQDGLVTMTRLLCLPPTAHPAPQTRPSWHACHSSFPKNLPSMICGHTRRQEEAMPSAGSNRTRQGEKCFYFCRWKSPGMTASKILLFLGLLWSYLLIRAVLVPSV